MCLFPGLTLEILPKRDKRDDDERIEGVEWTKGECWNLEVYKAWATPPYIWGVFAPLLCIGSSCSVVF